MKRVLFICEGNRARSQMAEALLRFHGADRFEAFSAGVRPGEGLPSFTVEAMEEIGVPTAGQRGKHFSVFASETFDYVITLCDKVQAEASPLPAGEPIHWSIPDPGDRDEKTSLHEAMRFARIDIRERIVRFLEEQGCVFCQIVAGEAEASFIVREEIVSAFVDVRPVNDGHVLVIPNDHYVTMDEVPEPIAGRMMAIAAEIAKALPAAGVLMEGYNLWVANGEVAGQEVFHVHLHVLPRFKGDGFGLRFPAKYGRRPPRSELDELATRLRGAMREAPG